MGSILTDYFAPRLELRALKMIGVLLELEDTGMH